MFNKVCMGIRDLMPEIAMHHLDGEIRPGRFTKRLIKRPTRDIDELRTRAVKFMQIEEHVDCHRTHQVEVDEKGNEKEKDRSNRPGLGQSDRPRENLRS